MRLAVVLSLLLSLNVALSLKLSTTARSPVRGSLPRRSLLLAATASLLTVSDVAAAEPEPVMKVCDDECMDARVARKQALLKNQDRRGKADAKVLFGADYQAGKREASSPGAASKIPLLGEFLLPTDVGGVNLGMNGGSQK